MHRNTWKRRERQVARFFGAERNPLSGGSAKHSRSDTLHPELYLEVKTRKRHASISEWRKTAKKAAMEKKVPAVCLAETGKPDFFIVCKSTDAEKILK